MDISGSITLTVRDLSIFPDLAAFRDFVKTQVQPKLVDAAHDVYSQAGNRAGSTFNLLPQNVRCVMDGGGAFGGFRGVEISVGIKF